MCVHGHSCTHFAKSWSGRCRGLLQWNSIVDGSRRLLRVRRLLMITCPVPGNSRVRLLSSGSDARRSSSRVAPSSLLPLPAADAADPEQAL
ncbi:Protein of unknown function, partial [Gryllus bimaculatus]